MKIQQIMLNNVGPYIGESTITFNIDEPTKNIILIGGRNGAGKTTLFDAMRICLYGYKLYGYRQNSQTYSAKIKKLINDRVKRASEPQAGVSLSILIEDGYSKNIFTIVRNWRMQKNQVKEFYTVQKNSVLLDDEERLDFDNYLLQTIPPALFNFHFFNGENIAEFLFDKENGQSFRKAFMQICGLDTLDLIQEQLHNNIREQSVEKESSLQKDYYEQKIQKESMEVHANEVVNSLVMLKAEILYLEDESALLEQQMTKFGGVQSKEWQELQDKLREEENLREETHRFLKECANHTLPFLILKNELMMLQEQIYIEGNIQSNRAVKERLLKDEARESLRKELAPLLKNADSALSDDFFQTVYRAVRYDCPEDAKEFLKLSEREQVSLLSKVAGYMSFDQNEIINAEKAIKKSLSKTKRLRTKSDSKEILSSENYLGKKANFLSQIDELRKQIVDLTAEKASLDERMKIQTQEFEKASARFKEILKEKSVSDIAARALLAFDELKETLYKKYITQVEDAFIHNFGALLSKDTLLDGIYISEDFEIIPFRNTFVQVKEMNALIAEDGAEYVKEHFGERALNMLNELSAVDGEVNLPIKVEHHFSAGEQQIYVMSLYQALSEIRSAEIPFVIDTPLARIDSEHRKNILKGFFSRLPGQVVILSTDEEIDDTNIKTLQTQLSDIYLIENHSGDGATVLHNQYFKEVSN